MAAPLFRFDTLRARKILTSADVSDQQADAILEVMFKVAAASMAHKSPMSLSELIVRFISVVGVLGFAAASWLKILS